MSYTRFTHPEREEIALGLAAGRTSAQIGALLGRSGSTISREILRHGGWDAYRPLRAQTAARRAARQTHRRPRVLDAQPALLSLVTSRLRLRWSPQQICQWLRREHPEQPSLSAETVYQYLYALPRGTLKRELLAQLRRPRQQRRPKTRALDGRGQLPDRVSIHERPAEVEGRQVPGHWEADLVMGAGNRSAIATLVERTSRLVLLVKLEQKDAASVAQALTRRLKQLPASLRKTLTYDQGKEMARHADLTLATGIAVYFCDPHSPWQRGSNENTNGLIRDFFPKGTDFATVSAQKLNWVQQALNERPRLTLDWKTPKQIFNQLLETPIDALAT
jgi:transposase, IS30 family